MHYGAGVLQLLNEETSREVILNALFRKYLKSLPLVGSKETIFKKYVGKLLTPQQIA